MRRLVIGDIHGCSKTFEALLDKLALSVSDTLYLLGDYIDRGPCSSGVLDILLKLIQTGYNVVALRGNHEENMLAANREYDVETLAFYARRFKSDDLLQNGRLNPVYEDFMNQMPYYVKLPDFFLVHAGIDFSKPNFLDDTVSLLELRNMSYDAIKAGNRKVVFGHQPTNLINIQQAIWNNAPLLPLDNGCVYNKPHKIYDYKQLGALACLNLDSMDLTIIKNTDSVN